MIARESAAKIRVQHRGMNRYQPRELSGNQMRRRMMESLLGFCFTLARVSTKTLNTRMQSTWDVTLTPHSSCRTPPINQECFQNCARTLGCPIQPPRSHSKKNKTWDRRRKRKRNKTPGETAKQERGKKRGPIHRLPRQYGVGTYVRALHKRTTRAMLTRRTYT